jgi:hypothetical protein
VRARLVPRVGVGVEADFGAAWGAIFGASVELGVQRQEWKWGGWSVMGKFRWAPSQPGIGPPTGSPAIDVSTSLLAGSVAGCIHRAWPVSLAGCVLGELGEVQESAEAHTYPNVHQTALFAGGGVGARVEAPVFGPVYVQIAADVRGVARLAGKTDQWVNANARNFSGAAGGLAAGLGASF